MKILLWSMHCPGKCTTHWSIQTAWDTELLGMRALHHTDNHYDSHSMGKCTTH
jgi:hypothetical protein